MDERQRVTHSEKVTTMNQDVDGERADSHAVDETDETVSSPNPDHDKSVVFQLANVEFQTYDDNSQDLFDDESSVQNSPIINFNESPNAHLTSSFANTPKITNNWSVTRATVPSIPMSLVPFISTVNESWNSELETPEAKIGAKTAGHERFSESIQSAERKGCSSARSHRNGVIPEMKTPSGCFVVGTEDEELCVSPILNITTNRRRRPKRRILKSLGDTTACSDSPKKNTDATESLMKPTKSLPHVVKDNLTSVHDGDIQILGDEGEVKKEWGFITFTELCMKEGTHCGSDSSSPRKDVDPSLKEKKNSYSMEKDEPLIDNVEFTPWVYRSDEENEAHVTKENQSAILMKKNEQTPKYSLNSCSSIGFSTAGGKPIKISEEKIKNAEKIYNELSLENGITGSRISSSHKIPGDKFTRTKENETTIRSNSCTPIGFSTAGGKPMKISEEKLKNAEKVYNELSLIDEKFDGRISTSFKIVGDDPTKTYQTKASNLQNSYSSIGFSTAGGKPLKVSEDKLKAAEKLYQAVNSTDEVSIISAPRGVKRQRESNATVNSSGFKTAAGKPLVFSETAIKKARVMYDSENIEERRHFKKPEKQLSSEIPRNESEELLLGFCRVSGKALMTKTGPKGKSMSHKTDGLQSLRRKAAVDDNLTNELRQMDDNNDAMNKKSRTLTDEEQISLKNFDSIHRPLSSGSNNPEPPISFGFTTAGGKTIKISDQALSKARGLLETEQENTPLILQSSKRLRVGSETGKNDTAGVEAKTEMLGNDRPMTPKLEPQKCWPLKQDKDSTEFGAGFKDDDKARIAQTPGNGEIETYSEEITASTEALQADEDTSLDGKPWGSEIPCTSAAIQDREISARPITLRGEDVQEIPTSPIIGSKIRANKKIRRNKKRRGLKIGGVQLKINKDNEILQDQTSSGATTPTSDSSKASFRNESPLLETVFESKLEGSGGSGPTTSQSSDGRSEIFLEATASEMDDNYLEARIAATLEQEKKIRIKKKQKPKPIAGSLLLRRSNNKDSRISWREATNGNPPVPRDYLELTNSGIAADAIEMTAATALSYKFKCPDFYSKDEICSNPQGLDMGDGFRLIFDNNGFAGAAEFERAFIAGPGVDPDLVPEKWVGNHYRWIVWKLASMDRIKFGDTTMPRMLTPRTVMEQLKYRHDREIDKSERPALRRIIEKDDPPCRRMVLCVATIAKIEDTQVSEKSPKKPPTSNFKVELTDGWYGVPATIDSEMANLIGLGKIREGTKLITSGAEFLNCDQACSPLEIPGEASLKIHTNSTRRSRWDAKLGYCKHSSPISTSLSSILPNGGLIGKLNTVIARVYPNQYFEKTWSGTPVFRNNKCEDKAAMKYEAERQAQLELICSKAQAEFEARNRRHSKTFSAAFSGSEDPDSYQACFSDRDSRDENAESEAFQKELESILRQSLPPPRKVTMILKVRLMGGENPAILTVWAPNEDTVDLIKEGNRVSIHNVQTSGKRSGDLQLTAGRQSFVKLEASNVSSFPQRKFTPVPQVGVLGFNPPFGEFDTVGIVVSLGPAPHGMKNFEVVDLAYPPSLEAPGVSTYLSILFWEGIGAHGFSDILTVGSIVACNNLQWRRGAPRTIPLAYSTEYSTFTRNPRQNYLRSAFESVKNRITDCISFVSQSAVEIALERQKKSTILRSPAVHCTPSKGSPSASYFSPGTSPQTLQGPPNTGKDSTPGNYSMQRRLEKLQWYGEPPDLSPVTLKHASNKFNQRFIPPVRTPEH